ncbi:hypothetical protein Metok_0404 [Methanothermococcus okinawensis IH1]|uniref:Uncharacterized protein n=2 Tax=Methanothermococcus okinawensis TaxID=155863 RepID=F8AKQ4_METOI|nr:hypothetical protein Metok_0404 [Methanothermococcus okinawensis IH1]
MIFLLINAGYALEYKWSSTIPIEFVPLSSIHDKSELDNYLSNSNIVLFYMDDDFIKNPKNWILYELNITEVEPDKIPDYGNYTYLNKNNIFTIYPKKYVYRDNSGALIYSTPKEFNNSKYKIEHITPEKQYIPSKLPDLDGYAYISKNNVCVIYPEKYVYRDNTGALIYVYSKYENNDNYNNNNNSYNTNNDNNGEYKLIYESPKYVPDYYNYAYISRNNVFIIYPKKYLYMDDDGALIYNPPANPPNEEKVYNISTRLLDGEKGIFEIKNKKILITHPISKNDKSILDFIGHYVSENNGTFVYINKAPPYYKHVLINGVVVQKAVPDKNGDYVVDVAGRKIKVDLRDDSIINKKIKTLKGICNILNANLTYISTGSENLKVIKEENPDKDELDTLLNDYWFKKWYQGEYHHTYYVPSNIKNNYNIKHLDVLAMSYYPIIYVDKAPETFKNDPADGYYPETINYKGTDEVGYWEKGTKSNNKYYHYDENEPHWNDNNKYTSNWYYEGKPVLPSEDSAMNDKYKYFNHWFVKNYGYAVSEGVNGLLLTSNDKNLVDAVFGRDNDNLSWKLDIKNKLNYVVIPDYKGFSEEDNISIIKVPGLTNNEIYGMHHIDEYYIPPKDEEFGVYVADIVKYDTDKIYALKDNYTWICSFKNYADWADNYLHSDIKTVNNRNNSDVIVKSNKPVKITIYKKGLNISSFNNKMSIEEYNRNLNKIIIYTNGSSVINLN